jgi:hypothetical protein
VRQASARVLRTEPLGMAEALCAAEALRPGDLRRFEYQGDLLGAAVVTDGFAPVPLEAFDALAPRLEAEAQAAYFHFLRLSFGSGRNFCRVPRRELRSRLGLAERRLNRVLGALEQAGAIRAHHRDNRGTLYRVFLPSEIEGRSPGGVVLGARCEPPTKHSGALEPLAARKAGQR